MKWHQNDISVKKNSDDKLHLTSQEKNNILYVKIDKNIKKNYFLYLLF